MTFGDALTHPDLIYQYPSSCSLIYLQPVDGRRVVARGLFLAKRGAVEMLSGRSDSRLAARAAAANLEPKDSLVKEKTGFRQGRLAVKVRPTRTNEIGVRMALGADPGNVLALILREALVLMVFGLLLGVPLSLATGRLLGSQLYGVNHHDYPNLAAAILTLTSSALIAALIPAFRASSILPSQALRAD